MPKAGSTTLQSLLTTNATALAGLGLSAHPMRNIRPDYRKLVASLREGQGKEELANFTIARYERDRSAVYLSCEAMFYQFREMVLPLSQDSREPQGRS